MKDFLSKENPECNWQLPKRYTAFGDIRLNTCKQSKICLLTEAIAKFCIYQVYKNAFFETSTTNQFFKTFEPLFSQDFFSDALASILISNRSRDETILVVLTVCAPVTMGECRTQKGA